MAFDENKYKAMFEQRYGSGSFDSGLSQARDIGRLKVQASVAKQDYTARLKAAQAAAKKAATKKTYNDAIAYFNDPINKAALQKDGAYRAAENIKNDPNKQAEIKAQGYNVGDYINGMYHAASGGKFKSEREYNQFSGQLNKDTQASNKAADKKSMDTTGYNVQDYWDQVQKPAQDAQKKALQNKSPQNESALGHVKDFFTSKDTNKDGRRDGLLGLLEKIDRPGDAIRTGIKEKAQGHSFWQGAKDGFLGNKDTSGTELNKSLGFNPDKGKISNSIAQFIARGFVGQSPTGGLYTPAVNDKIRTGIGKGTAGAVSEMALDPLNLIGTGVASKLSKFSKLAKGANTTEELLGLPAPQLRLNEPQLQLPKPFTNRVPDIPNKSVQINGTPLLSAPREMLQADKLKIEYKKEFQDAVKQQYDYLKNSMGKGVDYGTTGHGLGNLREVNGSFSVSRNPKWYQDFYKTYGRKPNNGELMQLAQDHVKNGFADEVGNLPAFTPKSVQEIDNQINQIQSMIKNMPDQETQLQPILSALNEDRSKIIGDFNQAVGIKPSVGKVEQITPPGRSTKLEDIVKENGFNHVTPETIAQSFNNKSWYHGTGTDTLKADSLDPFVGDHQSLFGHGVYLTDEPSIARGYAKSRSKRTSTPTIYETKVNMNKVLDLEKPIPNEAKDALLKTTNSIDHTYKRETFDNTPYFSNIVNDMASKGATTEQIIQKVRSEVSDFSHQNGISTNEFVENFQDLAMHLKKNGYDGITHTGGGRTGHDPHRVLIALDPNDWYSQTGRVGQITKFNPRPDLINEPSAPNAVEKVPNVSNEPPLSFKTQKAFNTKDNYPLNFTGKMNPKDMAALKATPKGLEAISKPGKGYTNIGAAPKGKTPGMLPASELDNHGYGLFDTQAATKAQQSKIAPALLDETRQAQGNANSFRAKINDTPKKDSKGLLSNLHTQFIDDLSPLSKIEKQVTGKISSAENSLYKQARNYKGSPEKAHLIVQEQLHPLFNEMEKSGIDYKNLRDYALAVHAKDVNAKGINSGFTNTEINDVINQLNSPKMEELRKKLVGVNDYAMKLLSSGDKPVLNPADVSALKEKWPNYMSLFRSFDDNKVDFSNGISKSMANVTSPIKKLEGSDKNTIDPMESVIKNLFKAVNVSDRNNVAAQIGNLAEKDTQGNFIRKLANNDDTSRLNVISVMDNGKKVKYEVPPEVYRTMMNLDKESSNTLVKILQKPAGVLRAGATLTPEFSLRNPLRDVPNAFGTSNSGFNPVTDFPVGLWQSIWKGRTIKIGNKEFKTSGELYKQFIKENGGYGNIISMDRNLHQKLLKQALTEHNQHFVDVLDPKTYTSLMKSFANPIKVLRTVADVSESATKVGEFRAALRSGTSPQEAAYRARDLMDFARAGTSVREANKVVAFLNANIQGKSKLFRAFKENPAKFTGKAVASVTLPTIGTIVAQNTYANDNQKAVINDAPQWLKDTFYLLPIPGTDQIARIPKPFDLAFAFSNTIERAFNFVAKHDKHAFDNFIKDGFSQAAIPVMLTGLAPIVEGMANYSFFRKGAIIPQRETNLNYPDQYDVNTSETAKFVGKGINKVTGGQGTFKNFGSPRVIDNTIQGFTGGSGAYVSNAIDWFLNSTGAVNNPDRPAKNIDQQPLAKAFLVNQSSSGGSLDKLYNLKDKLTKEKGSAKQSHQPFAKLGQYNMANQATKSIGKISSQIRTIQNSPSISAEQKRSMMDDLIKQRNTLALQTMQRLNQ